MTDQQRRNLLKFGAIGIVALFLLDRVLIEPAFASWKARAERIAKLEQQVNRGTELLKRENTLRTRWAAMQRTDLHDDVSTAEHDAYAAVTRWAITSKVIFTNFAPQWRDHDEGYRTYECRASATGNQAALARFLYEVEADQGPVALHECEITTRDATGQQLSMTARFSFVQLARAAETNVSGAPSRAPSARRAQ